MIKKDSIGNELPQGIMLTSNATAEQSSKALVMNSFLLAVRAAMQKGKFVVYDADSKTASITDEHGRESIVWHE